MLKHDDTNCLKPDIEEIAECGSSDFISLFRMRYSQDGERKSWDFIKVHDSVAVLLYDLAKSELVLVKQFRPPVYMHEASGITYELCAGITDKNLSLEETASEEITEETGYKVPTDKIKKITSFYSAVSYAGSRQTLYCAEVDDSMKTEKGGGVGNEKIIVVRLPFEEIESFMYDEQKPKTPGLLFSLVWFRQNVMKKEA
jgi:UDP-sugar diphosphatase